MITKVHCMFEQSGTFKKQFIALGIDAEDYDIQNNFNQTDNVIDLFAEIESAYMGGVSVFDKIRKSDLIIAFFPCIYFEALQMPYYTNRNVNNKKEGKEKFDIILDRIEKREKLYKLLYKLIAIVEIRGLRLIVETPATQPHYLLFAQNFYCKPTIIDKNRLLRGDYYRKQTAYWFFNIKPTYGESFKVTKAVKTIQNAARGNGGLCSEERSMISQEYAKNFICDFILGRENENTQARLF